MPLCENQGSCGKCFEVRCVSKFMWYDQGNTNDKSSCYAPNKSVVITVADACPNIHPINKGKGNENPCGESSRSLNHMDLNRDAFRSIANLNDGIIHMEFRPVDCSVGPRKCR
ncbi:RlpA-like double-psi beta-barrel-protein domain-containing protein-containing protein [Paraphysoderma sedebokerense]|nr:RlpA-like double-psi beta-barrel-protein domain-containing protein-containing protein [Paraphysoderma sedebokerense]